METIHDIETNIIISIKSTFNTEHGKVVKEHNNSNYNTNTKPSLLAKLFNVTPEINKLEITALDGAEYHLIEATHKAYNEKQPIAHKASMIVVGYVLDYDTNKALFFLDPPSIHVYVLDSLDEVIKK